MSVSNPWLIVICGFSAIFIVSASIRTYRARKLFRASFYTELYSGFFEYNLRRKSLKRLSVSNWLNSQFGEHRIFYQMTQAKKGEAPQAYILLILSTGVYTILCKNFTGIFIGRNAKFEVKSNDKDKKTGIITKITRKATNPVAELKSFKHRWKEFVGKDFKTYDIVVFTDGCQIDVEKELTDSIPFINRKDLFSTIKTIHEKNDKIMSDDEIIVLYRRFVEKTNK